MLAMPQAALGGDRRCLQASLQSPVSIFMTNEGTLGGTVAMS